MSVSYDGFHGKNSFGHVSVYTDADGTQWARITINGVLLAYEQISSPADPAPTPVEPPESRLPAHW